MTTPLRTLIHSTPLAIILALFAATPAYAAKSSPGSGEVAIYTEAGGADPITTADFTHDFDTTTREDVGSFSLSGGDITLNRTGHYLAIYNSRFDRTGTVANRTETQSQLRLNATDLPSGWSQGYTRWDNEQKETITSGIGIFAASAGDVLQLHSFRTDNNGGATQERIANGTAMQLVKLDEVNMSFARLSLASDVAGPTTDATFVTVPYDTEDELGSGFSYDGSGGLTLVSGGKYLVAANTHLFESVERSSLVQHLSLDGTEVPGSVTEVYIRGNQNGCSDGAAAIGMIIEATPGQVLRVEGRLDVGRSPTTYIGGRCALSVVKIEDNAEYIRLINTADVNVNTGTTETPIALGTQDEVDAAAFAHTAATSAVTVQQDGDYLFLGSFYGADDGVQRGFPAIGWSINGAATEVTGQTGRYSRNSGGDDEFGNTSGMVATLTANDTVELVSFSLGNTGTNNANPIALQAVRLESLFTRVAGFEVVIEPTAIEVTEGGATATYEMSIGLDPTSGSVDITVTSDADTEVSLDGTTYTPTVTPSFTAGLVPQTIHVRAFDDGEIERPGACGDHHPRDHRDRRRGQLPDLARNRRCDGDCHRQRCRRSDGRR